MLYIPRSYCSRSVYSSKDSFVVSYSIFPLRSLFICCCVFLPSLLSSSIFPFPSIRILHTLLKSSLTCFFHIVRSVCLWTSAWLPFYDSSKHWVFSFPCICPYRRILMDIIIFTTFLSLVFFVRYVRRLYSSSPILFGPINV